MNDAKITQAPPIKEDVAQNSRKRVKRKKWKIALICVAALVFVGTAGIIGLYMVQVNSINNRVAELNAYPNFADDGIDIVFTFDLNRRDLYADLIAQFGLDDVTAGYYDVDLMIVLQNWVTDNFNHHGASSMPENRDAISIINFLQENPRGINCRGLAILLAELLRLYGIEAKHITIMAPEDDHPVHVVTHAFSRDLQQWIMLDPTFNIYLQDEHGTFMNLYTLRRAFAQETQLFANDNARVGSGGMHFWTYFMSDYLFRFRTATDFTFGTDDGTWHNREVRDTSSAMLVPVGFYNAARQADLITTSANTFFATP